jgi:hypothetical protein
MDTNLQHHQHIAINRHGVIGRRDFLRTVSAAGLATGALGWTDLVSLRADELRRRGMACILLWMQGGPSQFETLDPKPGHANRGETKAIDTSVPGIQVAENLPHVARVMDRLAVIRSMTTREGNHQRASFLLHTGYAPTASVKHPAFGSIAAQQLGDRAADLPSFVRIGGRVPNAGSGGFLGVEFDPFAMPNPGQLPDNTRPTTDVARYQRRLELLSRVEQGYATAGGEREVADHQKLYGKAARMVLSPKMRAFDLSKEPDSVRSSYGGGQFGLGCLLARRLVESGVTFIEVASNGWDTHQDNFNRSRQLCGQVDQPFAALVEDLASRGLLQTTLVVWMGEFGRTPAVNVRGGRDHYPRAFSVALAGGGVRGGQVIGATSDGGTDVTDRAVTVQDLFQTFCHSLKIDPTVENMTPIGRPIKIVDGGQVVSELFT